MFESGAGLGLVDDEYAAGVRLVDDETPTPVSSTGGGEPAAGGGVEFVSLSALSSPAVETGDNDVPVETEEEGGTPSAAGGVAGLGYSDDELFTIPQEEPAGDTTGEAADTGGVLSDHDEALSGATVDDKEPPTPWDAASVGDDEVGYVHGAYDSREYPVFPLWPIVTAAIDAGASDVYVKGGDRVSFKILDQVVWRDDWGVVNEYHLTEMFQSVVLSTASLAFTMDRELDVSYVVPEGPHAGRRCRMNVSMVDPGVHLLTLRVLDERIPTPDQVGLTRDVLRLVESPGGLILFTGVTGSGKTSSIAALLGHVQAGSARTVLTIEKPIEYVFDNTNGGCLFIQREVGRDTKSFEKALNSGMRQNPNVILIGEVRDRVEVDAMLRAAETGHLTISTIHSLSAPVTLSRIKSLFEGGEQARVLSSVASTARGFIAQALVPTVDGLGRFAVREKLLFREQMVRDLVAAGDVPGLRDYMVARGVTMEHELARAVKTGLCSVEGGLGVAPDPVLFTEVLGETLGGDYGYLLE